MKVLDYLNTLPLDALVEMENADNGKFVRGTVQYILERNWNYCKALNGLFFNDEFVNSIHRIKYSY